MDKEEFEAKLKEQEEAFEMLIPLVHDMHMAGVKWGVICSAFMRMGGMLTGWLIKDPEQREASLRIALAATRADWKHNDENSWTESGF